MLKIMLLLVPLLLTFAPLATASMPRIDVSELAPWHERRYSTALPQPFAHAIIIIKSDERGNVTEFSISTALGAAHLPTPLLRQLSKIVQPEITYKGVQGESLKSFSIHLEFGEFYYSDRFNDSFQSIAGWSIDHMMQINDFAFTDSR